MALDFEFSWDRLGLAGVLSVPEGQGAHPAVILARSLQGDRHEALPGAVAQALAERGLASLRFDSDQAFSQTTLSGRSAELGELTTLLFEHMLEPRGAVDIRRLGVFGHELGGAAAILRGAEDTRLRAIAASSPAPSAQALVGETGAGAWMRGEPAKLDSASTLDSASKRRRSLDREFLRDWRRLGLRPLCDAAEGLTRPLFLISGEGDEEGWRMANEKLYFRRPEGARLALLEGGRHFRGQEQALAARVADFFVEALAS